MTENGLKVFTLHVTEVREDTLCVLAETEEDAIDRTLHNLALKKKDPDKISLDKESCVSSRTAVLV